MIVGQCLQAFCALANGTAHGSAINWRSNSERPQICLDARFFSDNQKESS